jgi:hypothetical protein
MTYKKTLDAIEENIRRWEEAVRPPPMSAFIPDGYVPLAEAIERVAKASFPEEYARTNVNSAEQERLARYDRAVADLKRLAEWERARDRAAREILQRIDHAERARRASAPNLGSYSPNRSSKLLHKKTQAPRQPASVSDPPRPMSEDQERAARQDAVEGNGICLIQRRREERDSLIKTSWMRLRQALYKGHLVGHIL